MSLRDSGLVNESRGVNGAMVYRIWTKDRMFQFTAPKHQDATALERSRAYACADLARQLRETGLTIADVIAPTELRGVVLK